MQDFSLQDWVSYFRIGLSLWLCFDWCDEQDNPGRRIKLLGWDHLSPWKDQKHFWCLQCKSWREWRYGGLHMGRLNLFLRWRRLEEIWIRCNCSSFDEGLRGEQRQFTSESISSRSLWDNWNSKDGLRILGQSFQLLCSQLDRSLWFPKHLQWNSWKQGVLKGILWVLSCE